VREMTKDKRRPEALGEPQYLEVPAQCGKGLPADAVPGEAPRQHRQRAATRPVRRERQQTTQVLLRGPTERRVRMLKNNNKGPISYHLKAYLTRLPAVNRDGGYSAYIRSQR
jgi:hypothetical protein